MHDPEFEKNIQKKMEELDFNPPESVWDKVALEIQKDKKRRRPIIWFFLFLGLALAGSIYYMLAPVLTARHSIASGNPKISSQPITDSANKNSSLPQNSGVDRSLKKLPDSISDNQEPDQASINKNNIADPKSLPAAQSTHSSILTSKKNSLGEVNELGSSNTTSNLSLKNKKERQWKFSSTSVESGPSNKYEADRKADLPSIEKYQQNETSGIVLNNNVLPPLTPALNSSHFAVTGPISDPVAADAKKSQANKNPNHHSWNIGYTTAPGISTINKTLFNSLKSVADVYSFYAPSVPPTSSAGAPLPSTVQSGFSFTAGAFVEKKLSNKLTFSTGLNYHYYSNQIQTGAKIDSMVPMISNFSASQLVGYYHTGTATRYTNQYHFLELPVSLRWQFNNSKSLPLSLEGGLTISQMLGSNALHYNSLSGIYYKDNDLFRKTQFGGTAALLVGFYINHSFFQAGPQVQYGLSNMLKDNNSAAEHLFFTGIKLTIVPKKK